MWTFKMFFQDDGEFFEYDPFGMQGAAGTEKAFPYLEGLSELSGAGPGGLGAVNPTGGLGPGAVLFHQRPRTR